MHAGILACIFVAFFAVVFIVYVIVSPGRFKSSEREPETEELAPSGTTNNEDVHDSGSVIDNEEEAEADNPHDPAPLEVVQDDEQLKTENVSGFNPEELNNFYAFGDDSEEEYDDEDLLVSGNARTNIKSTPKPLNIEQRSQKWMEELNTIRKNRQKAPRRVKTDTNNDEGDNVTKQMLKKAIKNTDVDAIESLINDTVSGAASSTPVPMQTDNPFDDASSSIHSKMRMLEKAKAEQEEEAIRRIRSKLKDAKHRGGIAGISKDELRHADHVLARKLAGNKEKKIRQQQRKRTNKNMNNLASSIMNANAEKLRQIENAKHEKIKARINEVVSASAI